MTAKKAFRNARMVMSFALLGAVIAGAFFGWVDTGVDPRTVGAFAGGLGAITFKVLHFL